MIKGKVISGKNLNGPVSELPAATRAIQSLHGGNPAIIYDPTGNIGQLPPSVYNGGSNVTLDSDDAMNALIANRLSKRPRSAYIPTGSKTDYMVGSGTVAAASEFYKQCLQTSMLVVPIAEHIPFVNYKMFTQKYAIVSTDYAPGTEADANYRALLQAGRSQASSYARRIANLVHAMKTAILAQTNDTNPFYEMYEAEIYDRVLDYITNVNRVLSAIYNIRAIIGARDALSVGALEKYNQYSTVYTADAVRELQMKINKMAAGVLGQFIDVKSCAQYMQYTTLKLAPSQIGSFRVVVPVEAGYLNRKISGRKFWDHTQTSDGSCDLNHELLPYQLMVPYDTYSAISRIKATLDRLYDRLFTADSTMAVAAMAPFSFFTPVEAVDTDVLKPSEWGSAQQILDANASQFQLQCGYYGTYQGLGFGHDVNGEADCMAMGALVKKRSGDADTGMYEYEAAAVMAAGAAITKSSRFGYVSSSSPVVVFEQNMLGLPSNLGSLGNAAISGPTSAVYCPKAVRKIKKDLPLRVSQQTAGAFEGVGSTLDIIHQGLKKICWVRPEITTSSSSYTRTLKTVPILAAVASVGTVVGFRGQSALDGDRTGATLQNYTNSFFQMDFKEEDVLYHEYDFDNSTVGEAGTTASFSTKKSCPALGDAEAIVVLPGLGLQAGNIWGDVTTVTWPNFIRGQKASSTSYYTVKDDAATAVSKMLSFTSVLGAVPTQIPEFTTGSEWNGPNPEQETASVWKGVAVVGANQDSRLFDQICSDMGAMCMLSGRHDGSVYLDIDLTDAEVSYSTSLETN